MELRQRLTNEAFDLYKYVSVRYPAYENSFFERGGSSRDDAFRHLLRAAYEDTPQPRRWGRSLWPDADVAQFAADSEVRRRAWGFLADDDPEGWREQWVKRNRRDRIGTQVIITVGLIAAVVGAITAFW